MSARGDIFALAERHPALIRYRAAWKIRRTDQQRAELRAAVADARASIARHRLTGGVYPWNFGAWMVLWLWDEFQREDEIDALADVLDNLNAFPGSA